MIDPGAAKTPAQLADATAAASTDKLKYYVVTGRNGAGSLSLSGGAVAAVSTDTLVDALNLTDGGSIKSAFTTVTTGGLTQTGATDYSAKKLLVILRAA